MPTLRKTVILCCVILSNIASALAFQFDEHVSIEFLLSHGLQCQDVHARLAGPTFDDDGTIQHFRDACRGTLPFRISPTVVFNENHTISAMFGYTIGNGINENALFAISPWGIEFENDLKDINGRGHDYILTAWYAYHHPIAEDHEVTLTVGLLDSTEFLDQNAFANDEYHHFMSDVFVNNVNHALPIFDVGGALQWRLNNWGLTLVLMDVGQNDDGRQYNFWGAELGFNTKLTVGEGNYRFFLGGTSRDFLDTTQEKLHRKLKYGISFDQSIYCFGFFTRISWQKQDAAIDYKALYSAGLEINGQIWSRTRDRVGIAYAHLDGGNVGFIKNNVFEIYYKYAINDLFHITFDLQHQNDVRESIFDNQMNPSGWTSALRLTANI